MRKTFWLAAEGVEGEGQDGWRAECNMHFVLGCSAVMDDQRTERRARRRRSRSFWRVDWGCNFKAAFEFPSTCWGGGGARAEGPDGCPVDTTAPCSCDGPLLGKTGVHTEALSSTPKMASSHLTLHTIRYCQDAEDWGEQRHGVVDDEDGMGMLHAHEGGVYMGNSQRPAEMVRETERE